MRGRQMRVHVRCGNDIEAKLRKVGLEGDYLAFADPIWLGPGAAFGSWLSGRARLVADRSGLPYDSVRQEMGEAYSRLGRLASRYDHIILWFEHDLYDQACLVRVLASLAARPTLPRVELVCIDRFPGIARFIGLGQLAPEQLAGLWSQRKPVGRRQLALGARALAALRADSPQHIEALLGADLRALPFLGAALRRHLQELPWTTDGLALTERLILVSLLNGPRTPVELFNDTQARDPLPYTGDLFFWSIVRDLLAAPRPPIAVHGSTRRLAWRRRVIRLTPIGKALLDGRRDWQAERPAGRWVGGIPVGAGAPGWRWDPGAGHTTGGH
ncbi:MAG: hypothetical protein AB7U95_27570 [Reyranella sp.]